MGAVGLVQKVKELGLHKGGKGPKLEESKQKAESIHSQYTASVSRLLHSRRRESQAIRHPAMRAWNSHSGAGP